MTDVSQLGPRVQLATRRRVIVVALVVVAAFGFLVWRGLGNATMYFRTADEAVAQRAELGDRRFRLEGRVVPGSVVETDDGVSFVVVSSEIEVPVVHTGDPPELFQDDIPVVLEGRFAPGRDTYESDRIMVRHTSEYREQYPERVEGAPAPESER